MILNDGREMVLVLIWDEGEGGGGGQEELAVRPGTKFKWLPTLTNWFRFDYVPSKKGINFGKSVSSKSNFWNFMFLCLKH